jgi:hypothetical protein
VTRLRAALLPLLVCLVVGAAGWASRAELDEVVVSGARQRIALVPSWQPFVAFLAFAAVLLTGLEVLARRARGPRPTLASLVLPAFGLTVLLVPYLPGPPDWWPALQALAGPGLWIVWALVATQCVWTLWPHVPGIAAWCGRRSLRTQTAAIWIVTAAAAGLGAGRLTHTVLFPSGDEPHYLIIAQSLWRDGDLRIEDNHARKEYAEYFRRDLDPHYLTRGLDGEIYSVHPVGMPVLITPVYALGGYTLVVAFFVAMAATAATVMWRWVVALTGTLGTPTLAWAAIVLSAPFLINAFTIYPEIPAALVVALAVVLTLRATPGVRAWHDVAIGLLVGALPWLSTKYAPMSAAIVAVAFARRAWPLHAGETRWNVVGGLRIGLPYGLCLLGWFAFFYAYWGTPMPSAPYGPMTQTAVANTIFGVPGLLFDQEYGLVPYAPAYLLAGLGFWTMLRRPGPLRRVGLEAALIFGALLFTVGAFRIWWGGSAAPGRPITSGLLVLMLPITVQVGTAAADSARRAAQHLLIWSGVGVAAILVVAQDGLLVSNGRDGTSTLLAWLSPRWPLWTLAPTFVEHEAGRALLDTAVWLAIVGFGSWGLARVRAGSRGAAALTASTACALALVAGGTAVRSLPPADPPLPGIDLAARARLTALDAFDQVSRPLALRYAPLRVASALSVESAFAVGVTPGLRREPQPVRVLHNGRFSLPAGRYRLVVQWASRDPLPARPGATVALQVGRIADPMTTWTVTPTPGGRWTEEFWLPVDAGFVGLRGTAEVERSIAAIRIEAVDIIDEGARTATPPVLAASAYGDTLAFFHEERMYPEPGGFWTTGRRPARVTLACANNCAAGVVLRVHSGARPNHLRLATHGWSQEIELTGGTEVDIQVPPPATGNTILLELETTTGFVPMEVDPSLRDERYLGVWVAPMPSARETP